MLDGGGVDEPIGRVARNASDSPAAVAATAGEIGTVRTTVDRSSSQRRSGGRTVMRPPAATASSSVPFDGSGGPVARATLPRDLHLLARLDVVEDGVELRSHLARRDPPPRVAAVVRRRRCRWPS
jgi:hypothetical protein